MDKKNFLHFNQGNRPRAKHLLLPAFIRVRKRLWGIGPIEATAVMVDEIGSECFRDEMGAVFEDVSLNRVRGANEFSTLEAEYERFRGGERRHRATRVYEIRDVLISSGQAFTRTSASVLSPAKMPWFHTEPIEELASAAIMSSWVGIKFFGHWLVDDLPSAIALERYAPLYSLRESPWRDELAYSQRVGVSVRRTQSAFVRRLFIIDDMGQNLSKRIRTEEIKRRLRASVDLKMDRGIFMVRGSTGVSRRLENEEQLIRSLDSYGIDAIDTSALSPDEIIRRCSGATFVIGVEGSQLSHGLIGSAPGAPVLAIQPPTRFNHVYKVRCDCLGSRYGFVVAEGDGDGFSVDIDETRRVLDRLLEAK